MTFSRFPKALHQIASGLKKSEIQQWYLRSTIHDMGLSIKRCHNKIVIKYYDPNDTLRHKRIVVESLGELTALTPEAFWDDHKQNLYFQEKDKVGCLNSIDRKADRDECQVTCMANPSATLMYLLLEQGHYGHTKAVIDDQQIDLSAKRFDGVRGFYMALQNGHSEAVKDYVKKVLARDDLTDEQKKELLTGQKTDVTPGFVTPRFVTPGFFMALQHGHSKTVAIFLQEVLASDLTDQIKEQLLTAEPANGTPGFFIALQLGRSKVVAIFLKEVLASCLPNQIKERLITAKRPNDTPGFFIALYKGHTEAVKIFLEEVLASGLPDNIKELLLAAEVNSTWGIYEAFVNRHHETVKIFKEKVLASQLNEAIKQRLVQLAAGDIIKRERSRLAFANYCNKKVKKISFESSVFLNDISHSPREITTLNDFAISYFSKGLHTRLNGKSKKPLIKCRHLAYWWVKQDKPKYDEINTLEKLQNCQEIPRDKLLDREVTRNGCASKAIYFDLSRIPKALHQIASGLNKSEIQQWYLHSTIHAMGLSIKRCHNKIVIKYYDPNDTLRHKRIVVESLGELTALTPEAFWDDHKQDLYFPEKNKVGYLSSIDRKADRDDCQVICMANPSAVLRYYLLYTGHYGHREAPIDNDQIDLSAKRFDGLQGFYLALQDGHSEAVKDYVKKVLARDDLTDEQKKELLAGQKTDVTPRFFPPGFFLALQNGHSKTVEGFLKEVLASDLPDKIKEWLLTAKREDGTLGFFMALQNGHSKVVEIFLKEVLASGLPNKFKEWLIAAEVVDTRGGVGVALKNGHTETVKVFRECVLASRLSEAIKQRLVPQKVRTV